MADDIVIIVDETNAEEIIVTAEPIISEVNIEIQQDYAPVQAVNGKIGWVTLDKTDIGLSNVENVSILGASGYLQTQINNLDSGYATDAELRYVSGILYTGLQNTGSYLNTKIDNLSGVAVLKYGDQSISGIKTFVNKTYVSGLKFQVLGTGTAPTPAYEQGLVFYDNNNHTLNLYVDNPEVSLQVGQENWVRIKNTLGATLNNGSLVYIAGGVGANPYVQLALANSDTTSAATLGMATHNISTNEFGYITTFGIVNDVDTDGYSVGDTLYLSPTTSGQYTNVKPQAPYHMVSIGTVIRANKNNGVIFVNINNGFELEELHDVRINNKQNGQFIVYNSGSGVWYNTQSFPVRPYVNGTPILLSGEVAPADLSSTVQLTGNQNISGIKNFYSRPTVNGTGIMLSGEAAQLPTTIVYTTGEQEINGFKTFNDGIYSNLIQSEIAVMYPTLIGSTFDIINTNGGLLSIYNTYTGIDDLNINLPSKAGTIALEENVVNLTGQQVITGFKKFSGVFLNPYNIDSTRENPYLSIDDGNKFHYYYVVSGGLGAVSFGPYTLTELHEKVDLSTININNIITQASGASGYNDSTYATIANLESTGSNLDNKINSLSGVAVLTYGNQTINGNKTFNDNVYIQNLTVTGTQTIVNTTSTNVGSNYVLLNATGGARDAGIFIVTGVGMTGVNDTGAIIGYDVPANQWVFGNTTRNSDLSTLAKIASTTDISNLSGSLTGNYFVIGGNSNGSALTLGTNDSYNLNLETSGIARLTILSGGNIGIGTATPTQKLDVNGNIISNSWIQADSVGGLRINNGAILYGGTNGYLYMKDHANGILMTSVSLGPNTGWPTFSMPNAAKLNITTTSGVGINNSDAQYTLDVSGSGRFSRDLYIGNTGNGIINRIYLANPSGGAYFTINPSQYALTIGGGGASTLTIDPNFISTSNNFYVGNGPMLFSDTSYTSCLGLRDGYGNSLGGSNNGLNIYKIYSGANREYLHFGWSGYTGIVGTRIGGNGSLRDLIVTGVNIYLNSSGNTVSAGRLVAANGTLQIGTNPNTRIINTSDSFAFTQNSTVYRLYLQNTAGLRQPYDQYYSWSADNNALNAGDTAIYRDEANIIGIRNYVNSNTPQSLRVYNLTGTNSGEFGLLGWQNNNLIIGSQQTQSGILRDLTLTGANININASGQLNIFDPINVLGNLTVSGNATVTGHLAAATKSFLITHPTDPSKKLQYGSLESPYHGIRLTDRAKIGNDSVIVKLPDYISSLVNNEKTNIQLTNINHSKVLFVKEVQVAQNYFVVGMNRGWFDKKEYEFYWSFTAERKDVPRLEVEF